MTQTDHVATLRCCICTQSNQPEMQSKRQSHRSTETLAQQKRSKKVGRPKLPKGEAKGRIVPVRFTAYDLRAMAAAAKANNQSVSEWNRSTLNPAMQQSAEQI